MSNNTRDMLGRKGLTPVDEALNILLTSLEATPLRSETIPLYETLDRVTATAIISPEDLPSHARSTMDGFAVHAADTLSLIHI